MSLLFCGLSVRSWNLITSLLHLGNGVAIVALRYVNDKDLLYGIQQSYPDWSRNSSSEDIIQGEEFFVRKRDIETYELSLTWLIAVFFFLSFAFQWRHTHSSPAELLRRGRHPLRFIEYSLSSRSCSSPLPCSAEILNGMPVGIFLAMFSATSGPFAEHLAMKPKEKTDEENPSKPRRTGTEHLTVTWILT